MSLGGRRADIARQPMGEPSGETEHAKLAVRANEYRLIHRRTSGPRSAASPSPPPVGPALASAHMVAAHAHRANPDPGAHRLVGGARTDRAGRRIAVGPDG